jgi:hypothetical protein
MTTYFLARPANDLRELLERFTPLLLLVPGQMWCAANKYEMTFQIWIQYEYLPVLSG